MVPGPVLSELGPVALLVPSDLGPAVQDALLTVQTLLAGGTPSGAALSGGLAPSEALCCSW